MGTEYRKWLLIIGDKTESVMVAATFPKELEGELSEKMRASVLTARWDRERKVAPTEGLNFTFTEKGELRLAKRIASSLLYTKSGIFPSKAVDDPLFIIGQALSKLDIDDREQFAKSRLSQTATITEIVACFLACSATSTGSPGSCSYLTVVLDVGGSKSNPIENASVTWIPRLDVSNRTARSLATYDVLTTPSRKTV